MPFAFQSKVHSTSLQISLDDQGISGRFMGGVTFLLSLPKTMTRKVDGLRRLIRASTFIPLRFGMIYLLWPITDHMPHSVVG